MAHETLVITEAGFLTEFLNQHTQRTDRPFCFILGAGVSRSSGIPTGGEMAKVWLRELYEQENFDGLSLEDWATSKHLGIKEFELDNLARFYPHLYRRRFGDHEQAGYAFLESQMEGKEPSYGYSVLSYLLSETSHRVVITTNFDNLVADALSIHSSRFPLVIGHDALAEYASVELRRPLVAKVHGALGFSPKSHPDDISDLPEGWCTALERILQRYTPIVIGYEGNDGSLMGFLQSLPAYVPDRVWWCVYAPNVSARDCLNGVSLNVCDYVKSRRGRFVPIRGFDELMAKLLKKLGEKTSVPDLYERLQERARQREQRYDEQQRKLFETAKASETVDKSEPDPAAPREADTALSEAVKEIAESRKEKPWWVWLAETQAAPDDDSKERIYLHGLDALPTSASLLRSYALFLEEHRRDYDKAEAFYRRALEADPKEPLALGFYGEFLNSKRNDPGKAEEFLKRALEVDPNQPYLLRRYAEFLRAHNNMDKAEELYIKAIEINPRTTGPLERYADFLREVRGDHEKAEELERRARAIKSMTA